jgi:hypothetical protein
MSAVEEAMMAEEAVLPLQGQLGAVESVLESAEDIAVNGEQAGRCLRRLVRVLLLVAIVAAVVMLIKKVKGGGATADDVVVLEASAVPDSGGEATGEDDTDASDDAAGEEIDAS